jgi:hypothetical protein
MAGAVVAGPLAGLAAYKLIFPIDARRRMDILVTMMVGEVAAMAASRNPADHRLVWRARLFHRMLRLIRWTEKTGDQKLPAVDGSLAVLTLGEAVLRLRGFLRDPDASPGAIRSAMIALGRVAGIVRDPVRAQHALARAAQRLAREERPEAVFVHDAAQALAINLSFFRRAAGRA